MLNKTTVCLCYFIYSTNMHYFSFIFTIFRQFLMELLLHNELKVYGVRICFLPVMFISSSQCTANFQILFITVSNLKWIVLKGFCLLLYIFVYIKCLIRHLAYGNISFSRSIFRYSIYLVIFINICFERLILFIR